MIEKEHIEFLLQIVNYSLKNTDKFTINSTGWVLTNAFFDRETTAQEFFKVEAVDGAPSSINPPEPNRGRSHLQSTLSPPMI